MIVTKDNSVLSLDIHKDYKIKNKEVKNEILNIDVEQTDINTKEKIFISKNINSDQKSIQPVDKNMSFKLIKKDSKEDTIKANDPIYPSVDPENCMSSIDLLGKATVDEFTRFGNNTYTVVGVYDFDDRAGKANLNIVLRPNKNKGGHVDLDSLKNEIKVTVEGDDKNLLIFDDSKSDIYDPNTKSEDTNIISYSAFVQNDDIDFKNNPHEIPTLKQVANREKNIFNRKILNDLDKNTSDPKTISNPRNPSTVTEIDNKGEALTFLDRPRSHSCCIYNNARDVYIPVLALELKDLYKSMNFNESKIIEIKSSEKGSKDIKLMLTKIKPINGKGNWKISCPINNQVK